MNSQQDQLSTGLTLEPIRSRWISVLVALDSMGTLSVTKLMQFLPGIRPHFDDFIKSGIPRMGDHGVNISASLLQCNIPVSCFPLAEDKFSLIGTRRLQPQTDVSRFLLETTARACSSLSPSIAVSMTRDLKDYINWRVQFALMPPSRSTLRQALSDLTCKYV
jgi:hypothetical protein